MASREDDVGFNWTGVQTDGGIRGITQLLIDGNHTASRVNAASGHDLFSEIDATDLANLVGTLPSYALPGAAWILSPVAFAQTMGRLSGDNGGIVVLNGEPTFWSFPIRITSVLPNSTSTQLNKVMILFGDASLSSTLGETRAIALAPHRLALRVFRLEPFRRPAAIRRALVEAALPPSGYLRAPKIGIDDALGSAARCRRVALRQRRVAAFVIVGPPAVHVQAHRVSRIVRLSQNRCRCQNHRDRQNQQSRNAHHSLLRDIAAGPGGGRGALDGRHGSTNPEGRAALRSRNNMSGKIRGKIEGRESRNPEKGPPIRRLWPH
jgi:hypothetical protein